MRIPRWLVYSILTLLFWGGWSVIFKLIGDVSPAQSQAFSTVGMLPLMIVLALRRNIARGPRNRRGAAFAFIAGLLAGLGNIAYFKALAAGGDATIVNPLTALYPVVTIILAVAFLREKLSWVQGAGVLLALAAIYLFNPSDRGTSLAPAWLAYGLLPIGLWGISAFVQKLSTNDASSELTTLAFWSAFVPIALVILLTQPIEWRLSPRTWMWLILLGALFALGNLTLLAAYAQEGKASIVTPMAGLYSVVSIPLAIIFLHERVEMRGWGGIALALLAVVALSQDSPLTRAGAEGAPLCGGVRPADTGPRQG